MAGIPSLGGVQAASSIEFQTQRQAAVAGLQKDAIEQQGDQALQLIQSASLNQAIGQNLDELA